MTQYNFPLNRPAQTIWKENRPMAFLGFFSIGLVLLTLFAAIFDGRIILNVNG